MVRGPTFRYPTENSVKKPDLPGLEEQRTITHSNDGLTGKLAEQMSVARCTYLPPHLLL